MKKSAFITGASGGIGRAAALRLAQDGFAVACCFHNDKSGAELTASELKIIGADYRLYSFDVADFSETEKNFNEAVDYFGGFDVLVNCAGIALQKLLTDTSCEEFDRLSGVNFKGIYNTCHSTVPYMVQKHSGKIINISSMWGTVGASCEVVYSATKAAVIGFTKALARELAPSNIQVNCIAPGVIETKMNDNLSLDEKAALKDEIPACRFGTPEEIAGVISFLASKDSDYLTAQVITVDGGLT